MDFAQKVDLPDEALHAKLGELARETGCIDLLDLGEQVQLQGLDPLRDALSTRLMEVYRDTGSPLSFSLIYELNSRLFFLMILGRLRRHHYLLDAGDILQEVFLNVFRYPLRFKADRPGAFRFWAATIIRNTILRALRNLSRDNKAEQTLEEMLEPADETEPTPQDRLIRSESSEMCQHAWLLYLRLYLNEFNRLSLRERDALHLVEVEGFSYREVSAELAIKVENLKMVIFRARKKIVRNLQRTLEAGVEAAREEVHV